tara:strand:- start:159 stop:503 length:345 start_codon:yes stop_codon:yes gene_type:complete
MNQTKKIIKIIVSLFFISCNSDMELVNINTPTIQCGMCQKTIEKGLSKIEGLSNPKVDLKTKITSVSFNPEKIKLASIEKKISDLGYEANEVKANQTAYVNLPACCKIGGMDKM